MPEAYALFYFAAYVPVLGWAGVLAHRWMSAPAHGREVYAANIKQGLLSASVPEEAFVESYARAERPLMGACLCGAALLVLLILPALISLLFGGMEAINAWSEEAGAIRIGRFRLTGILGDFVVFVSFMIVIVGVLIGAFSLYYVKRPPTLKSEIRRLEQEYR